MTVEEGDGNKTKFYFNEGTYAGRGTNGVKTDTFIIWENFSRQTVPAVMR